MKVAALPVEGVDPDDWTLAPFWSREGDRLVPRSPGLHPVDHLVDADVGALTAVWSAYEGPARRRAVEHLDEAGRAGRRVVVWVDGDQEIDLDHPAAILFEQGPERSRPKRHATVHAWPVLIHDHLQDRFGGEVDPVPRGERPRVGFCGQAAASWSGHARFAAGKARDRARHALGRTDRLAAPWPSHLRLRRRVLDRLAADERVEDHFLVRDRYRAGLVDHAERADRGHPTAEDFFGNVRSTAYTVCVRGGGNFSTRLYETLCLGRIPVLVDTDVVLPWAGRVPWPDLAVVVDAGSVGTVADAVVAHHRAHDGAAFAEAQAACRRLWVERLSTEGFFAHLPELLATP